MQQGKAAFILISEVARICGVSVQAIRLWEKTGVIAPTIRTTRGVRLFDVSEVERIARERAVRSGLSAAHPPLTTATEDRATERKL